MVYQLPCTHEDSQFSAQMVLAVLNFKYVCSEFLCYVVGMFSLSSWLFLWLLICGLLHVLCLSPVINF